MFFKDGVRVKLSQLEEGDVFQQQTATGLITRIVTSKFINDNGMLEITVVDLT